MRMRLNPAGDIPLGCPSDHPPKHKWDRVVYNDFIFGGDDPAPAAPDYSQLAAASEKAAQIGADLGREQLAESKRQYEINRATAEPVVAQQLALMKQSEQQGTDYYKYMTDTYRPLERSIVEQATAEGSPQRMEEQAAQAAADARRGQVQQANMVARQGLRYGYSPAKMAAMQASLAGANSSAVAGAMTGARNQQRNLGYARQLDAAGLGRNLPNAAAGAYGLTLNAGNSAVSNTMAPGNALLTGMAQGAGFQQTGIGQKMGGLGNILSAQGSYNNMLSNYTAANQVDVGSLLKGGASVYTAFQSDRRLKQNIEQVSIDPDTGLGIYEFEYIDGDSRRFRGVMADEVEAVMPEAVVYDSRGYALVNYSLLGIDMVEVKHAI